MHLLIGVEPRVCGSVKLIHESSHWLGALLQAGLTRVPWLLFVLFLRLFMGPVGWFGHSLLTTMATV